MSKHINPPHQTAKHTTPTTHNPEITQPQIQTENQSQLQINHLKTPSQSKRIQNKLNTQTVSITNLKIYKQNQNNKPNPQAKSSKPQTSKQQTKPTKQT